MNLREQVSYFYLMNEAEPVSGTLYFFNQKQNNGNHPVYVLVLNYKHIHCCYEEQQFTKLINDTYLIDFAHSVLALDVCIKVCKQVEPVILEQDISHIPEFIWVGRAEEAILNLVHTLLDVLIAVIVIICIVAMVFQLLHFIHSHPKDKYVLSTHLLSHFHVGSIKSTNCQGSIQLQTILWNTDLDDIPIFLLNQQFLHEFPFKNRITCFEHSNEEMEKFRLWPSGL